MGAMESPIPRPVMPGHIMSEWTTREHASLKSEFQPLLTSLSCEPSGT